MTDTRLKLLADTVARPHMGGWLLMNKQEGGLASSAETFAELGSIPKVYQVRLGGSGKDKHGPFVRVVLETP